MTELKSIYTSRPLSEGYPDLERRGVEFHAASHPHQPEVIASIAEGIARLVDISTGSRAMLVVGCGPKPHAIRQFQDLGYAVKGVEPVPGSLDSAREFLQDPDSVLQGTAEALPVATGSQRFVIMTSVLEHVDSPQRSLAEIYRTLEPGGVLFIYTTNRWKFHWAGRNGEYSVPFFNWFPAIVQESYVFHHLHYKPTLANYNARPAFHWFTYSGLCSLGRQAGFAHFYSLLDVVDTDSPWAASRTFRRLLIERVKYSPWLRALALTQAGGSIYMVKRPS